MLNAEIYSEVYWLKLNIMHYISKLRFTWHLLIGRVVSRKCQAHIMSLIKIINTKRSEQLNDLGAKSNDKMMFYVKVLMICKILL